MEKILKFATVGFTGFFINSICLILGVKVGLKPSIAGPLGAEVAILSNFILNNFWTFSDKTITSWQVMPLKFIQFNLFSFGAVFIQFAFLRVGELIFTVEKFKKPIWLVFPFKFFAKWQLVTFVFTLPFVGKIAKNFSVYLFFFLMATGVGMVVNYLIYSQIIWK